MVFVVLSLQQSTLNSIWIHYMIFRLCAVREILAFGRQSKTNVIKDCLATCSSKFWCPFSCFQIHSTVHHSKTLYMSLALTTKSKSCMKQFSSFFMFDTEPLLKQLICSFFGKKHIFLLVSRLTSSFSASSFMSYQYRLNSFSLNAEFYKYES